MTPEQIAKIKDPAQRAREAQGFIVRGDIAIDKVRETRNAAIAAWRAEGGTQRHIAAELGLSPGLLGQLDARRAAQ